MSELRLNAYHIMWLFVMFDLPTTTKKERGLAAKFRKSLEKDGFTRFQYSVYIRFCGSLESSKVHIKRVKSCVPPKGSVSILSVTDKQYSNIINIWGEIEKKAYPEPQQLEFFNIFVSNKALHFAIVSPLLNLIIDYESNKAHTLRFDVEY